MIDGMMALREIMASISHGTDDDFVLLLADPICGYSFYGHVWNERNI